MDQVELYDLQWGLPKGKSILPRSRPPLPDFHYHSLPAYIKEIVEEDSSEDENDGNDGNEGEAKKDGKADEKDAYGLLDETLGLLFSDEVGQADQKDPDGGKPVGTVDLLNDTAGLIDELYNSEDEEFNNQARLTTANQLWQSPIPRARIPLSSFSESPFSATDVSPITADEAPKKKRTKLPAYARSPGVLVI